MKVYVRDRVEEEVRTVGTRIFEDAAFHVCRSANMARDAE
jgi:sulfite reductase alpha subunit-like flavoprotein